MTDPTPRPTDADGCVLETYESRTIAGPGSTEADRVVAVLVCRSHGWTETAPRDDEPRQGALVASHKAALSGRVLNVDGGALVIEVRDPSLYEHPDLVEGLRAAAGARTVVGIDPDALDLYVTPDELTLETLRQALDGIAGIDLEDAARKLADRLRAASCYLVRVSPEAVGSGQATRRRRGR